MAGERATFDTQLTLPPDEARRVRLSFAGGQSTVVTAGQSSAVDRATEAEASETPGPAASDTPVPEH